MQAGTHPQGLACQCLILCGFRRGSSPGARVHRLLCKGEQACRSVAEKCIIARGLLDYSGDGDEDVPSKRTSCGEKGTGKGERGSVVLCPLVVFLALSALSPLSLSPLSLALMQTRLLSLPLSLCRCLCGSNVRRSWRGPCRASPLRLWPRASCRPL